MCLTCGCMQPENDHKDHRNITFTDLKEAGNYSGLDLKSTVATMIKTIVCIFKSGKSTYAREEKCD